MKNEMASHRFTPSLKSASTRNLVAFLVSIAVLIALVLGFTGGLNITSFQKNYSDSLVRSYTVSGQSVVRKIAYAVKYGKPLNNFFGIDTLLQDLRKASPELTSDAIVDTQGRILYDAQGVVAKRFLPGNIQNQLEKQFASSHQTVAIQADGLYHVFLPITNGTGVWIGSLEMNFPSSLVQQRVQFYMGQLLVVLAILSIVSFIVLGFLVWRFKWVTDGSASARPLMIALLAVLGTVQLIFGGYNYVLFRGAYTELARQDVQSVGQSLQRDIQSVLAKGVPYRDIRDLNSYLKPILNQVPEVGRIQVSESQGKSLGSVAALHEGPSTYSLSIPLGSDGNGTAGKLFVGASNTYIKDKLTNILLDSATVFVTSFVFLVELAWLVLLTLQRFAVRTRQRAKSTSAKASVISKMVRPVAFVLCFGVFMPLSFIPRDMKSLYHPMLHLPKDLVIGLPVSAEMLFAGLATVVSGSLSEKYGWRKLFIVGVSIITAGSLFCALTTNPNVFILARGIAGAGYGTALMSLRSFANTRPETERSDSVSGLFAGMYAGLNSGVIVGAMLADRGGFSLVFLVTAVVALLTLVPLVSMNSGQVIQSRTNLTSPPGSLRSFFSNPRVLAFFTLILVPTAVCGMFLDYYFPLFAAGAGISPSNVGRAFLLNGLSIVYLGPWLGRQVTERLGSRWSILIAGLLVAGSLVLFSVTGGILVAFSTVILLGVADSIGLTSQNEYFVKLKATRVLGVSKALGYYGNVRKLGQMLGPMIFGAVASLGIVGVGFVGVVFVLFLLLFLVLNRTMVNQVEGM